MKHTLHILLLMAAWLVATTVCAQNNPYRIRDEYYNLYTQALQNSDTQKGLNLAQQLYDKASGTNDVTTKCLALSIYITHYEGRDWTKHEEACKRLEQEARSAGNKVLADYAQLENISGHIDSHHLAEALEMITRLRTEAEERNDAYGRYCCNISLARIYYMSNNTAMGDKFALTAMENLKKHNAKENIAPVVLMMASSAIDQNNYSKALQHIEQCIEQATVENDRAEAQAMKCIVRARQNDKRLFDADYAVYQKRYSKYATMSTRKHDILRGYKAMMDGNMEEAKKVANQLLMPHDRMLLLRDIALKQNDKKTATRLNNKIDSTAYATYAWIISNELQDVASRQENMSLMVENARLELSNAEAQHNRNQMQIQLSSVADEQNRTLLKNKNMELSQLRMQQKEYKLDAARKDSEEKLQREQRENEETESRLRMFIYLSVALLAAMVLLLLVRYYRLKAPDEKQLSETNEELMQAHQEAERANRMKTDFLHTMSHEIRTPLNSVVGFAQLLADKSMPTTDEERERYMQYISDNSEALISLINNVLSVTLLENGCLEMQLTSMPLNTLGKNAQMLMRHLCQEGVEMLTDSDVDDDYVVTTDEKHVMEILTNFLSNAAKYTSQGTITIQMRAKEKPGTIIFAVADTGVGVAPERSEEIFEQFTKLDSFKPGIGLGLSICRVMAGKMGGAVYLDTSYSPGARFVLELPAEMKVME